MIIFYSFSKFDSFINNLHKLNVRALRDLVFEQFLEAPEFGIRQSDTMCVQRDCVEKTEGTKLIRGSTRYQNKVSIILTE